MTLISIGWQALNRAIRRNDDTELCDCTIIKLFTGFFIEANLNYIIQYIKMTQQMSQFYHTENKNSYPCLQQKLGWFYNQFVSRDKVSTSSKPFMLELGRNLGGIFLVIA